MKTKIVKINESKLTNLVVKIVNESIKKILSEKQADWGGYYSDNSMGYNFWTPSTPEDAMTVAKKTGGKASDIYRGIMNSKNKYDSREQQRLGVQGDANVTNRRNLEKNQYFADPEYDRQLEMDKFNNPDLYRDRARYTDEVPSNHAQRQRELQQTFNANSRKLNRYNRRAANVNEALLKKVVSESIRKILRENSLKEYPYSPYQDGSEEDKNWKMKTFTTNTTAYWKAKHPEWSDEQCQKAAQNFSNHEKKLK